MAKSLQEILGGRNMTGVINDVVPGIPNYLPPAFLTATDKIVGNKATYFKARGERGNAKQTSYGAPARRVTAKDMAEQGVTLIHTFEEQAINPLTVQGIINPMNEQMQGVYVGEVDRQTRDFRTRFDNLRLSCTYSALSKGAIWFDSNGNVQTSSSGAAVTIDFSVPANNQNQANSTIGTTWATASTDIIANINAIKKTQVQNGRAPLAHAFYGSNIASYIAKNDAAKNLLNGNPALAQQFYNTGEIPNGFCGLQWHPVYGAYEINSSDAVAEWWGADGITFTPEPNRNWWKFYEGSFLVPRTVDITHADAVAAMSDLDLVYGRFAYGKLNHNPPGVVQYAGDTFLPLLADGTSIFIVDVTP